jgi:CheY-like chemotaxis protein
MLENRLSNIRILIIDDHADTRNLLRFFLEHCGAQSAVASNGQEALETIKTERPDLVISDLAMPHMDGYELMEKIQDSRRRNWFAAFNCCPAFARGEDRARTRQAGFQAHVEKPVDLDQLVTTILKVVNLPPSLKFSVLFAEEIFSRRALHDRNPLKICDAGIVSEVIDWYVGPPRKRDLSLAASFLALAPVPRDHLSSDSLQNIVCLEC